MALCHSYTNLRDLEEQIDEGEEISKLIIWG